MSCRRSHAARGSRRPPHARQRGAALFVALVMMLVVAIMTMSAASIARLQERMAGGTLDQEIAFQAAEMALRDAEQYVFSSLTSTSPFDDACTNGLCLPATAAAARWETIDWNGSAPIVYGAMTGEPALPGATRQPVYIIELLSDLPPGAGNSLSATPRGSASGGGTAFRITALAFGAKPGTRIRLQSVYVKQ